MFSLYFRFVFPPLLRFFRLLHCFKHCLLFTNLNQVIEQSGVLQGDGLCYRNRPAVVTTAIGQMVYSKYGSSFNFLLLFTYIYQLLVLSFMLFPFLFVLCFGEGGGGRVGTRTLRLCCKILSEEGFFL